MQRGGFMLIGVDGGATKVTAVPVRYQEGEQAVRLEPHGAASVRVYDRQDAFVPVPVVRQLSEWESGAIAPTTAEMRQGEIWIDTAADAIAALAAQLVKRSVMVGICMPGIKSADGRGLVLVNNGPRIPDYLDRLESAIVARGLELMSPIASLSGDGDCCGLGEQYGSRGLLRDVDNAYYLGCGTGIAEVMKLRGRLVSFDDARSWILKAWEMNSFLGLPFEQLVSMQAINNLFRQITTHRSVGVEGVSSFPEVAAAQGNTVAEALVRTAALILAELVFERLYTVCRGRAETAHQGVRYENLDTQHAYRGIVLTRIVLGQRLGLVCADTRHGGILRRAMEGCLAGMIAGSGCAELKEGCLDKPASEPGVARLRPGLLEASVLREAPALGAAATALMASGLWQP